MNLIDERLLASFRSTPKCEWCGLKTPEGADPHHIYSKGAGRVDIPGNLIGLCRECHTKTHMGHLSRSDLLAVAAAREGLLQDQIIQDVYRIRREPKS